MSIAHYTSSFFFKDNPLFSIKDNLLKLLWKLRVDALSLSLKDGWNRISENYQQKSRIPTDDVYWGDFVATESQLRILGDVRGKRILEIACGGAQNSIALSKWGAKAFGVDLSRKQILYGRKLVRNENAEVSLLVCNIEKLPFKDESFDIVTTAVSLHYAPDLNAVVSEASRVLVKDGYFTFSAAHPFSEGKLVKYRGKSAVALRNYFKRRIVRWVDKLPDGSIVKMHSYYRTLQDYFDVLTKKGFVVERYVELERLNENMLHPLDKCKIRKEREARQQYRIMKEAPYWIIFKACKRT
ncbi:MAG: class I SAM-dependent methyltransferase [Candidatus Bathyarchaeota archaeon]|nr:class I SAM-dependent methyltransferase [Candidatus Bathyarchaeota archaeon]